MKPLITAPTICLVVLFGASAQVQANIWDGSTNSSWSVATNWVGDSEPTRGSIAIASGTNHPTYDTQASASSFDKLLLGGNMAFTVTKDDGLSFTDITLYGTTGSATVLGASDWSGTSLSIDASTGAAVVQLTHAGTNTLDIYGPVTLTADDSANVHATLTVNASAYLTPDSIDLNGDPTAANGDAILVFNGDVTVQTSTGVVATGFAQVQVGSDDTFDAYNLDVGDGAVHSELDMNTGTGTMTATSLDILAGDGANEEATFKLSAGTLDVNGTVMVDSGTASGTHAKLWSAVTTLEFTDMMLDGYASDAKAILDLDQSVTQGSSDVTVADNADIEVANGMTFTIRDLLIGDNDDAGDDYDGVLTVSDAGTVSADRIVIDGESGSGSSLTVSSSTVETR